MAGWLVSVVPMSNTLLRGGLFHLFSASAQWARFQVACVHASPAQGRMPCFEADGGRSSNSSSNENPLLVTPSGRGFGELKVASEELVWRSLPCSSYDAVHGGWGDPPWLVWFHVCSFASHLGRKEVSFQEGFSCLFRNSLHTKQPLLICGCIPEQMHLSGISGGLREPWLLSPGLHQSESFPSKQQE